MFALDLFVYNATSYYDVYDPLATTVFFNITDAATTSNATSTTADGGPDPTSGMTNLPRPTQSGGLISTAVPSASQHGLSRPTVIGIIVGGALGGLALFFGIAAIYFLLMRQREKPVRVEDPVYESKPNESHGTGVQAT